MVLNLSEEEKKLYKQTMRLFKNDNPTPQEKIILKRMLIASWYRQKEKYIRYFTFKEFCEKIKERLSYLSYHSLKRKTTVFLFECVSYSAERKKIVNMESMLFGIETKYFLHATNGEFEHELESTQEPTF